MVPVVTSLQSPRLYFWNKVKEKVYENRLNKLFENERELKKWIESCLQSTRDSKSNQTVYWKIKSG